MSTSSAASSFDGSPSRPLLITAGEHVLDELLAAAGAAGVACDVSPDGPHARGQWNAASMVVVGPDAIASVAACGLARRAGVVVAISEPGDGTLTQAGLWQSAVAVGADDVLVLPTDLDALIAAMSRPTRPAQTGAVVVSVVGGRGGAGASVLAAALAVTAARRGARALLVDGDPLGGGLDLVVGGEDQPGMRWPDLRRAQGRVDAAALHNALPAVDGLVVLSWDRGDLLTIAAEAMAGLLDAARDTYDLVVIDLPRRLDGAAEAALGATSMTLLVVPAEIRATAAAARIAASIAPFAANVRLVVRGPAPGGLAAREIADALALPLCADVRSEPGLAAALERGEAPAVDGRGPLATFAATLLDELRITRRSAA